MSGMTKGEHEKQERERTLSVQSVAHQTKLWSKGHTVEQFDKDRSS
jgi:hypothetical protein